MNERETGRTLTPAEALLRFALQFRPDELPDFVTDALKASTGATGPAAVARELLHDSGEPEYRRACIEMTANLSGISPTEAEARIEQRTDTPANILADLREIALVLWLDGGKPDVDTEWARDALPGVLDRATASLEATAGPDWWKILGDL